MSTTNFKTDARSKRLLLVNKFRELAEVNQYKRDTKIARIAEFSFIQGALCADPKMADDPVIAICLMSGRSILSLSTEEERVELSNIYLCAVPCISPNGDEDFWFVKVQVPGDYENVDEVMTANPHHHEAARIAAANNDCDVAIMCPVYDCSSGRWESLLSIFDWDTATTVDLKGQELPLYETTTPSTTA